MKKVRLFSIFLFSLIGLAFGQSNSVVKFQGLDGSFIKFSGAAGGFRSFELRVDFDPFHFVAKGKINAGPQTEDLDLLTPEDIGIAFSYFPEAAVAVAGVNQYPAISEVVIFVQDEPTRIKDLKVELLPPLSSENGNSLLATVPDLQKNYVASMSAEARSAQEESEITAAIADPWSVSRKQSQRNAVAAPAPAPAQVAAPPAPRQQQAVSEAVDPIEDPYETSEPESTRVPNTNGAPSDNEGYSGSRKNRTWLGVGLAAAGGILLIYGVLQHGEMNTKLSKMQDGERAFPAIGGEPYRGMTYDQIHQATGAGISGGETYNDLENQKKGAEMRRNLALGLGTLSVGGSIIMFTF